MTPEFWDITEKNDNVISGKIYDELQQNNTIGTEFALSEFN